MTIAYRKSMTALLALTLTCFAGAAFARQIGGFHRGDRTLALSGSGSSDRDFDSNVASFELELALFTMDTTAIALRQGFGVADTRGSGDWNASSRLAFDYFFRVEHIAPFVGFSIGYLYGDNVKNTFIAGPEIGLRRFINDTAFVNVLVEYQFLFDSASKAEEQFDKGRFVYTLGLGVRL